MNFKILILYIVFVVESVQVFHGQNNLNHDNQFTSTNPRLILPVGHLGGITKVDLSPKKNLILTEDLNSDIIIIESDKLIELQRHNFGNRKINSSTFLNDSSIISICNDTLVSVWNFYTNEVGIFSTSIQLDKLYAEPHGIYCIDKKGSVYKLQFSSKKIHSEKFISRKAKEIFFKSEKEIFVLKGKKLLSFDLNTRKLFKQKFDDQITAISWNSIGNVILGFNNGEIVECDSTLKIIHNYNSISDQISVIDYINDSVIISGSYDFSVVTQNKKEILNSILFDDWIVGVLRINSEIITCTWNGVINKLTGNLRIKNDFETGLKKATFFCQRESNLFISFNDGGVCHYDVNTNQLMNSYYVSSVPILGIDVNHSSSEFLIWSSNGISVFDLLGKKIKKDFKISNIVSAKFIPESSNYVFCSSDYLYYNVSYQIDSIPLVDSWSISETNENSIITSGLNRIIEIDTLGISIKDLKNVGQIWASQKNKGNYFFGTSSGNLYYNTKEGGTKKILHTNKGIDVIEIIDKNNLLINCENGKLIAVNYKTKNQKLISDTKQDFSSWDFTVNTKSSKIIHPNTNNWNYKMDVDVLDFNGKILNKLENVGGEVVCINQSNKSIDFNDLDSNEVLFIVSDGSVKLWDINSEGNVPITQLGFDYFNLLKNELKEFDFNGAFLNSGLLMLPIPGVDTLTFMNLKNGDWLVHDSKYRFDGTPGAIEKLYFTCGLEIVELNQIKDSLYVPNLVLRYTKGETLEHIPQIKDLQICGYTPIIEPIDSLNYKIVPRNGGVGEVTVYFNGIQRLNFDAKDLLKDNDTYLLSISETHINLYRESGKPLQIKVIAKVADNSVSSRCTVAEIFETKTRNPLKPAIHALMIGVDKYKASSLGLKYAAKDANDLQVALQLAAKNYFNFDDTNRVFFYNLTISRDGKIGTNNINGITPDRGNIIKVLHSIKNTSKPEDIILLFFAGHGTIVDKEQLLLLTSESTPENLQGIKINELMTIMNEIPAGKRIFILDACYSGAAINNLDLVNYSGRRDINDAESESNRLKELDKLANKSGFAIITSSGSDQKALELPQYEHGLLTYALLSSLKSNQDVQDNANNLVLEKWFIAAEEEISSLNKNQSAEKMVGVSYNIGTINEEVKKSINLKRTPLLNIAEVINESRVLNDQYPWDDYQIREKIKFYFFELEHPLFVLDQLGDFADVKLIVKYNMVDEKMNITFKLLRENSVFYTMTETTQIVNLEKTIHDAVWILYNQLK